jgi:hypothetical protein
VEQLGECRDDIFLDGDPEEHRELGVRIGPALRCGEQPLETDGERGLGRHERAPDALDLGHGLLHGLLRLRVEEGSDGLARFGFVVFAEIDGAAESGTSARDGLVAPISQLGEKRFEFGILHGIS